MRVLLETIAKNISRMNAPNELRRYAFFLYLTRHCQKAKLGNKLYLSINSAKQQCGSAFDLGPFR